MTKLVRNRNFWFMLLGDIFLVLLSYYFAYYLRFEGQIPSNELTNIAKTIIWIVPLKLICLYYFSLYRGMWRYVSIDDLIKLVKACLASSAIIVLTLAISVRFVGFPRSVFVIDFLLTFLFVGGFRLGLRLYFHRKNNNNGLPFARAKNDDFKRILIVGAGDAGEKVLRELMEHPEHSCRVVGFIDDDLRKRGMAIHDVSVLGTVETLPEVVKAAKVEEVLITVPSATGGQMRHIVDTCEACSVRFKTLPNLGEIIDGRVSVKAMRDVNFQDLLGRPPVELDMERILAHLKGKRVLITGAGGSIGSELCRQILKFEPGELVLFDASETNLYNIQMELTHRFGYRFFISALGSVQDKTLTERVFGRYQPEIVFHAAAYKHVPMLERNPWQAVHNNIQGCQVVIENSIRYGADQFVLVSTDKAVRPTNVMGASKRVCELLFQLYNGNGTDIMGVRFGNVLGSSGSVIPLFREQIARGGPVTVTHPEIMRYFMTIPEACQLILQAGTLALEGEIFILEMGTPIKIAEMARDLIRLSGKEPGVDIEIAYTGLRPGEKLYEELITEGEGIVPTEHEKIMVIKSNGYWNGLGNRVAFQRWLREGLGELYYLADQHYSRAIREKLADLVPEYKPQETECIL